MGQDFLDIQYIDPGCYAPWRWPGHDDIQRFHGMVLAYQPYSTKYLYITRGGHRISARGGGGRRVFRNETFSFQELGTKLKKMEQNSRKKKKKKKLRGGGRGGDRSLYTGGQPCLIRRWCACWFVMDFVGNLGSIVLSIIEHSANKHLKRGAKQQNLRGKMYFRGDFLGHKKLRTPH